MTYQCSFNFGLRNTPQTMRAATDSVNDAGCAGNRPVGLADSVGEDGNDLRFGDYAAESFLQRIRLSIARRGRRSERHRVR